jgi:hypothetical protein
MSGKIEGSARAPAIVQVDNVRWARSFSLSAFGVNVRSLARRYQLRNIGLKPVCPADMLSAAHMQRSATPLAAQTGSLCSVRWLLRGDEFVDQRIGCFF